MDVKPLLLLLHQRLDDLDRWCDDTDEWRRDVTRRLEVGDERFDKIEAQVRVVDANTSLGVNYMRSVNQFLGRETEVHRIDKDFPPNASGSNAEDDTNPGTGH